MLTTLDWKGWVFKNYDMMNRLASPPWNKHNLNKTNLGSNSVINLTTHNITCKQIFQYHLGSIDTVAFQRTSREGLHSITQLQLAPSIEHQISAMFSILVRCLDIPSLLSILVVHLSSKIIWKGPKPRSALILSWPSFGTPCIFENIVQATYLKSLSWSHIMMIMVSSDDDHCINMVTLEIPIPLQWQNDKMNWYNDDHISSKSPFVIRGKLS